MSRNDSEEPLEALAAALDDLVREAVREDLARERGDVHARRLALEDVPEGLEIRVPSAHNRVAQLECGDIGLYVADVQHIDVDDRKSKEKWKAKKPQRQKYFM